MYKKWEENQVSKTQVTCCLDFHGLHMDAPSIIPSGSMNGWCWPTQKVFHRDLEKVEAKRSDKKAR